MSNTFKLQEGNLFPKDFFTLESNKKVVSKTQNIKFTLIDFWFSNCGPCISQMPTLVKLFTEYKSKGFQIISICSDAIVNKEKMKKSILEQNITWENLWDFNRKKTIEYGIHYFPTNFLLDDKGVIIKKNINLLELESLLRN